MGRVFMGGVRGSAQATGSWNVIAAGHTQPTGNTGPISGYQIPIRKSGSFSNLQINIKSGSTSTAISLTLRVNGSNQSLSVSPPDATSGTFWDRADVVRVNAGDTVDFVRAVSTASLTYATGLIFAADVGHFSPYVAGGNSLNVATAYVGWGGGPYSGTIIEASTQAKLRVGGTVDSTFVNIVSNGSTGAAFTCKLRKNGVTGNNSISVSAGLTGLFEDTSHTDTFASGDLINFIVTTPATGVILANIGGGFTCTDTQPRTDLVSGGSNLSNSSLTAGSFGTISGSWSGSTDEAVCQQMHGYPAILSNFRVNMLANTLSAATVTFTTRINGADGTQVVSIGHGLTGQFEDSTHTDAIGPSDLVCWKAGAAGGGSGGWTIGSVITTDQELPVPSTNRRRPIAQYAYN